MNVKYYQKSIMKTGAFCETADPKKASHFTANGGSFRPISELNSVIVNEPLNCFSVQGNVDNGSAEEALELPVLNYEGESAQQQEILAMNESAALNLPSTFVPKKEQKPAVRTGHSVTTLNDNEEEALPLPALY